jgi:hypothetical protein
MTMDDDKLVAYADGELEPAERAEIERAMASDAKLRERVTEHQRLRARLSASFDGALDEPVPERLLAAARGPTRRGEIVDLASQRAARWPAARQWGAMAASLAAGLLIGIGVMNAQAPLIAVTGDGMSAHGALARALDTQLASDEAGAVRIGLSFRAQDGGYCRTFDLIERNTAGLACRSGDGWNVAMTAAHEGGGQVRQAAAPTEILNAVDAMIDGEPLDATREDQARDAGWQ